MAIMGINAAARRRYTLKEDQGGNPTVFVYTLPTLPMQQEIFARMIDNANRLKLVDDVLRECIVDVENLQVAEDGNPAKATLSWKKDKSAVMLALSPLQRIEISDAIIASMQCDKETEKN